MWFRKRRAEVVRQEPDKLAADVMVPVPFHQHQEKERGYNEADLDRPALSPPTGGCAFATRPDQRILTLKERPECPVRGAFATRPGSQVDNLRVLLEDDVKTTGATLDACGRALLDAGPSR